MPKDFKRTYFRSLRPPIATAQYAPPHGLTMLEVMPAPPVDG